VLVKVLLDVAGPSASPEQAAAYAVVAHATLFVPVVLVGAVILWRANITLGQVAAGRAPGSSTGSAAR
jgi:hypothetical protein